jgi:hypothetical protein
MPQEDQGLGFTSVLNGKQPEVRTAIDEADCGKADTSRYGIQIPWDERGIVEAWTANAMPW